MNLAQQQVNQAASLTVVNQTAMRVVAVTFDREQLDVLKRMACDGNLTDVEFASFIEVCKRSCLDPFRKQIYAIKRGGKMTIQTSIDGFRVIAQRTGEYEGQAPAMWCGEDGRWTDSWVSSKPPAGCRIGVYRKGHREPMMAFARFASYAQQNLWQKMPEVMIAKCAEALALRKAFPEDLSGLYTGDEMAQADNNVMADGEVLERAGARVAQAVASGVSAALAPATDLQRLTNAFADRFDAAKTKADLDAVITDVAGSEIDRDAREWLKPIAREALRRIRAAASAPLANETRKTPEQLEAEAAERHFAEREAQS